MKSLFALCLMTAWPLAALAGGFTPPEGCKLQMTVQQHGCTVANHYICAGDPAGDKWTAFADQDGVYYVTRLDIETRWMESRSTVTGETDQLVPEARDHASFSDLLSSGHDSFDFATISSTGEVRRYRGEDRLTGTTRVIDGVRLEETDFDMLVSDAAGREIITRSGRQFISREMRLFFGGSETILTPGGQPVYSNETPASFAFDGEPGFGAAEPEYDCDVLLTALERAGSRS